MRRIIIICESITKYSFWKKGQQPICFSINNEIDRTEHALNRILILQVFCGICRLKYSFWHMQYLAGTNENKIFTFINVRHLC